MKDLIEHNGTWFYQDTPEVVKTIINNSIGDDRRLRIFYGDKGKMWLEEHDVTGYIGRSTGSQKIPLLVNNRRSYGGGALMTDVIVRIQDTKTKRVLFHKDGYEIPRFVIEDAEADLQSKGYTTSVFAYGDASAPTGTNVANFRTYQAAEHYVAFMKGERMSK